MVKTSQYYRNELRILCIMNFALPLDALKLLAKEKLQAPAEDVQDTCASLMVVR